MTTESRPARAEPRLRASALELRLYLIAVIAAVYTVAWRAIGAHASAPPPAVTATEPPPSAPRATAQVRPVPQVRQVPQMRTAPAVRVVRAPARTQRRVRTRSS